MINRLTDPYDYAYLFFVNILNHNLLRWKMSKDRYSITLSSETSRMIEELQQRTDADTVSEVFRNAIRLSYNIMEAQNSGGVFILNSGAATNTQLPEIAIVPRPGSGIE